MARVNGKQLFVMKMIQNSRRRRSTLQKLLLYLQNRRLLLLRLCFVGLCNCSPFPGTYAAFSAGGGGGGVAL